MTSLTWDTKQRAIGGQTKETRKERNSQTQTAGRWPPDGKVGGVGWRRGAGSNTGPGKQTRPRAVSAE